MNNYFNHTNILKKIKLWFLKMQKITGKRTAKETEEESQHLFKNKVKSLTQDITSLSLSSNEPSDKNKVIDNHTNRQPIKRS